MVFILVPLTGDGKILITYGILTEDEINTSRQESEDGEEHPISPMPFYKKGHRNSIILGFAGSSHYGICLKNMRLELLNYYL